MISLSLALTALLITSIAMWMLSRHQLVIPGTVLANYAIVLPLAGSISLLFSSDSSCSDTGGLATSLIWLAYGVILAIILFRFRRVFSIQHLKYGVQAISELAIAYTLVVWWLVKLWLYISYGNDSVRALQMLPESDLKLTYLETAADLLANQFLMAALTLLALRAAWRRAGRWTMTIGIITITAALLVGDISVGARRALVMLMVLYLTARIVEVGYQRCLRELLIIAILGAVIFIYYPLIRFNITDPYIRDAVFSAEPEKVAKGIGELFIPRVDTLDPDGPEIFREGVAQIYCRLNDKQIGGHSLAWGSITDDAVYIALPGVLAPNKSEKDPDARLAEAYDLYPSKPYLYMDLSVNPLLQLQADFGLAAFPVAVVIYAFLLVVGGYYLVMSSSTLRKLIAASLIWFVINSNEASLTQLIVAFRDFFILSVMVWFLEVVMRRKDKRL
jgi:hypothetical protein